MKYAIGCDPNASFLKELVKKELVSLGHDITDFGSDDIIYANVAIEVAEAVASGKYDRGVLVCGTGIGMSIAANKVKGAIAAHVPDVYSAERAIKSNNANILCMGAFTLGSEVAKLIVKTFASSVFDWKSRSAPKVTRYMDYDKSR